MSPKIYIFQKSIKYTYYIAWLFLVMSTISCNMDSSKIFSDEQIDAIRGYSKDELLLFYSFAKLAAIDYKNLNQTHLNDLRNKISYGVKTATVTYDSEYNTETIKSSASVVYPDEGAPSGGWPILVFMHHTMLRDVEAPSVVATDKPSFSFSNVDSFDPSLHPLLISGGMGFVVYAPDMLGFGISRDKGHPFMNKNMLTKDIAKGLDATIRQLEAQGIQINRKQVFISGYSHGAWVASQFYHYLNTNATYSNTYNVVATVSSAGVYYLQDMIQELMNKTTSSLPLFFPYMIYGYEVSDTIPINYADYFASPYDELDFAGDLFDGTHNNKYVDEKLSSTIATLYNANFIAEVKNETIGTSTTYGDFWAQANTDSVVPWKMSGKIYIIHHTDDEVANTTQIEQFIKDMKDDTLVPNQLDENIQSLIGKWGEGSAHEATALITYISGLYWLVGEKEKL